MKTKKLFIYIILSFLITSLCSPPPKSEPIHKTEIETSKIFMINNNSILSLRLLKESNLNQKIVNSQLTKTINDDYGTIEHSFILVPQNIPIGYSLSTLKTYTINSNGVSYEIIYNTCELESKDESLSNECKASTIIEKNVIKFIYNYTVYDGDKLIIKYKYNYKKENKDILLITETIDIPEFKDSSFCDYKLIIPDGYINLGLKENILKKESNTVYTYSGECPYKKDEIRYSLEQSLFKAEMGLYLENPSKFKGDVEFIFPRYYLGGKLDISDYKITSTYNKPFIPDEQIYEDKMFKIKIPSVNKNKVGVELFTEFSNKLTNDFKVYLPEKYYEINLSKIDEEIINKAKEIIKQDSDMPNYYKIGKFVNSYIKYDLNIPNEKEELSLKEIYERKRGVCRHITKLYNAMLNAIGIKTLYLSGWAFQNNQTFFDNNAMAHAWTAAFIDDKWIELDATWGLFEGVPVGHIFKNFEKDEFHTTSEKNDGEELSFYQTVFIRIASNNVIEEKKIIISGIIGICIILFILFLIYRKNNNKRLHSKFIEEKIESSEIKLNNNLK